MFDFIKELGKIDISYNPTESKSEEHNIIFKNYIKSVEDDYILIDFLFNKGVEYPILIGKQVDIKFKTSDGVYTGNCEILGKDDKSAISGIKISFPQNIKHIQQREYVRVPLKLKTEIVIFFDENGEDITVFDTKTVDISGSGLCFITDEPIKKHVKSVGFVTLHIPEEPPIEISLKHIYSREFSANGKKRFKNAFTFIEIEEEAREKLLSEIFLFQLEMKKNRILE